MDEKEEDVAVEEALDAWKFRFGALNKASIDAAREQTEESSKFKQKHLELRERAAELEALELLFRGKDEDSVRYRKVLRKKLAQ